MWVLRGVLNHDLNMTILELIAAKYERIDIVPTDYYQPELFMNDSAVISEESKR